MRLLLISSYLLFGLFAAATDAPYAVSSISPALLKGANVVKRLEEHRFELISTSHTVLRYKFAYTILNENGDAHAHFNEWYDKLRKVESIDGSLYDAEGTQIKKLKSKDVLDLSGVGDGSLMEDTRRKVHSFYHKVYPFTVEYEVEIRYNNSFHLPGWVAQEDEHIAVEQSSYTLIAPESYQFRHRAVNYKGEPVQVTDKGKKMTTWSVKNLPALQSEISSPRWQEIATMLFVAPTEFEVEGFKGNMSTWKEFGKFLYELKKDKDVLPDVVRQKVQSLVAGLESDKEKIGVLYDFLQQNTRYISIQLGIGGWQPYDAAYVAKKGYGDCKALSNYMYSLLKEAGIRSHYAVIKSGRGEHLLMEDFPSSQFNHVVLCVPLQKDTVWLECTSQTDPAGYMGDFTGNRKALLVDEAGGILVNTPRYGLKENLQLRSIKGKLETSGGLNIQSDTRYYSIQQDGLNELIHSLSKEKVKKVLEEELDLVTYEINAFKYTEKRDAYPHIEEALNIYINNYATATGKRIFLIPNLLNRSQSKLQIDTARKYELCFTYAYRDVDSIEIEVPEGYEVEAMPQPVSLKTPFGNYTATTEVVGNLVKYVRVREQNAARFPPKMQADLAKYYSSIYAADRSRIVLVKKS